MNPSPHEKPTRASRGANERGRWLLWSAAAAILLSTVAACEPKVRVVHDGWGGLKALADDKPVVLDPDDPDSRQVWTIELERFAGPDRLKKAQALSDRLTSEAGLPGVRIQDRAGFAILSVGRIYDPSTSTGRSLLAQVRSASLDGIQPYRDAQYSPTVTGGIQVFDPLNLKQFPGMYTLQVGFYDSRFGEDFRAAAEKAAHVLREQGDEAYFYHGRHRSMVTVGLFDYASAFVKIENPLSPGTLIDSYSPAVDVLQKKYPYNLGNGVTLIEKINGKVIGEQPSSLVRVPR